MVGARARAGRRRREDPGGGLRGELLSPQAAAALAEAVRLARETRWDSLRSPHVFMGLLAQPDGCGCDWGARRRADLPKLLDQFQELFHQEEGDPQPVLLLHREFLSDNVIRLFREAYGRALELATNPAERRFLAARARESSQG